MGRLIGCHHRGGRGYRNVTTSLAPLAFAIVLLMEYTIHNDPEYKAFVDRYRTTRRTSKTNGTDAHMHRPSDVGGSQRDTMNW